MLLGRDFHFLPTVTAKIKIGLAPSKRVDIMEDLSRRCQSLEDFARVGSD